ncbi:MAG TPA: hypothetical protein VF131_12450 [Blastocatellia bacterium]|nr:hypothetical protein [Blastocatellia bacterium]
MMIKRFPLLLLFAIILAGFVGQPAFADDNSFSSVVKHIESQYNGKRQGTYGGVTFARFLVKMIKPAGVKNFKVVIFKTVEYPDGSPSRGLNFHAGVRNRINKEWTPLVQYSSPAERQWTYVYAHYLTKDVKILVVTLQKEQAFVVQTKFSPEKLIEFMNNPKIMGISLKGNSNNNQYSTEDKDDPDEDDEDEDKPPKDK